MKILLANPPCYYPVKKNFERFFIRAGSRWPFSIIKRRSEGSDYIPFPFYLAYTAALLEKAGFEVLVNDSIALNQTYDEFFAKTFEQKPDVILFETSTPTIENDLNLIKKIKKNISAKICLAGPHATTFSKELLEQNKELDFVLLQEYEINFLNLVTCLREDKDLLGVKGISYNNGEKIITNATSVIDPLDTLLIPARHLFPANENNKLNIYWDGFCQYKPAVQMHATRGCPFRCNFCLWNQVMYGNGKYRTFSIDRIIQEMKLMKEQYKAKEIYFDDDTFTAKKSFVLEFCKKLIDSNLNLHWSCMGDLMVTDEEMIDAMSLAGCIGMKFGVESGCKEILKKIEKPIDFDRVIRLSNYCAKKNIRTHATFTFGLIGETVETMNKTFEFAKSLDVDSVQFSITTPFPGTRYYENLKNSGAILAKNWSEFDGNEYTVVEFENVARDSVVEFKCKAYGRWLLHKLRDFKWLKRQISYLYRVLQVQGIVGLLKILKKGVNFLKDYLY